MKISQSLPPLTRRQRDILAFFISYRDENSISPTLEEIAQNFGLNKVTIFGHVSELEKKGVLIRSAKGISRGLQLADDATESSEGGSNSGRFNSDQSNTGRAGANANGIVSLPICGTIAAGIPIEAIETMESQETLELSDLVPPQSDVYVLRVSGNSMVEDAICDGDMVLIERRTEARNGETVVAVLPGEETTLKRFYRENGHIRLQPANSEMKPIIVNDVELRGVVVGVVRKY
ncbi:MAG: repressor LexA [Planctomycetota bacterium]|jgi:repressor LexA